MAQVIDLDEIAKSVGYTGRLHGIGDGFRSEPRRKLATIRGRYCAAKIGIAPAPGCPEQIGLRKLYCGNQFGYQKRLPGRFCSSDRDTYSGTRKADHGAIAHSMMVFRVEASAG